MKIVRLFFILCLLSVCQNSYSSNFEKAIPLVLKHEGKLSDDTDDKGGITKYGISLRFLKGLIKEYPDFLTEFDLNKNQIIDAYDIRHMTISEATDLYRTQWWNKYGYCRIENQLIATKIFDFSVNMGTKKAVKLAQETINKMNLGIYLKVDGIFGQNTINVLNGLNEIGRKRFLQEYVKGAIYFYEYLSKTHPVYKKFLRGWIRRAKELG